MKYADLKPEHRERLLISVIAYVLIGVVILAYFILSVHSDRRKETQNWYNYLVDTPEQAELAYESSKDATKVTTGTYIENLMEVNLKSSTYRVEFQVWFAWEGDQDLDPANNFRIYKGVINSKRILKEVHDAGKNYQLLQMDVTVSKSYETKRFPLDSHQMRLYVESTYPIQQVLLVPDASNSGINRNISITGYEFARHAIGQVSYQYENNHGDPTINGQVMTSEIVTAFEINRTNFGLYFKCFIALVGTITWVIIALYICTYHRVDPLGMIPGALFGTVGNIMVGASLLPDALEMGLLEYVNLWGIMVILGAAIAIININRIRNKYEDKEFANYYGRFMYYLVLLFTLAGNITLPLVAYLRV